MLHIHASSTSRPYYYAGQNIAFALSSSNLASDFTLVSIYSRDAFLYWIL